MIANLRIALLKVLNHDVGGFYVTFEYLQERRKIWAFGRKGGNGVTLDQNVTGFTNHIRKKQLILIIRSNVIFLKKSKKWGISSDSCYTVNSNYQDFQNNGLRVIVDFFLGKEWLHKGRKIFVGNILN